MTYSDQRYTFEKGSKTSHYEFIGIRAGASFAELLMQFDDLEGLRDYLVQEPEHWHFYDDYFVIEPGEPRPFEVRSNNITAWTGGKLLEDFSHLWGWRWDVENKTKQAFDAMYKDDADEIRAQVAAAVKAEKAEAKRIRKRQAANAAPR